MRVNACFLVVCHVQHDLLCLSAAAFVSFVEFPALFQWAEEPAKTGHLVR